MKPFPLSVVFFVSVTLPLQIGRIPDELWGKWVISPVVPTRTIACWGDPEARALLGTELEYSPDSFRWKNVITPHASASRRIMTAQAFHDEVSGHSHSQVDFQQLGIHAKQIVQISIKHPPAEITRSSVEIP